MKKQFLPLDILVIDDHKDENKVYKYFKANAETQVFLDVFFFHPFDYFGRCAESIFPG